MWFLILIIFIVVAIILVKRFLPSFSERDEGKLPYYRKKFLLTEAESAFFKVLEQATEGKYNIFPQIPISSLIYAKDSDRGEYYHFRGKLKCKTVDFVFTNKGYLNPLLAIELDDNSHFRNDRIERDNFVEDALRDAGFPLLRINCASYYDVQKIKNLISEALLGNRLEDQKEEPRQ